MKILITSDTHGYIEAWHHILERFGQGAQYILHAGDVLHPGPGNPNDPGYDAPALAEAINNCQIPIVIAKGNCDSDEDQMLIDYPLEDPFALLKVEGLKILVTHGERIPRSEFGGLAEKYSPNLIVFGHIHLPVLEREDKTMILNPGSPSLSKLEGPVQTAALLQEGQITIFDVLGEKPIKTAAL